MLKKWLVCEVPVSPQICVLIKKKNYFFSEQFLGETQGGIGDCVSNIRNVQMSRVPLIEIIRNKVQSLNFIFLILSRLDFSNSFVNHFSCL